MEEGRREGGHCYITPVTTVGGFAKTDTTPGRALTQPCYHRSLSPKKRSYRERKILFFRRKGAGKREKGDSREKEVRGGKRMERQMEQ